MREQRLRSFGYVKKMDDEKTPVKTKQFVVDGSKSKTDLRRARAGYRFKKNGCKRPHFTEAWLQKPAHPCSQKNQAGFQEDEDIYQHSDQMDDNDVFTWCCLCCSFCFTSAILLLLYIIRRFMELLFQRYKTIDTVLRVARNIVLMKKMTQRKYQRARHGLSNNCEERFDEDRETLFVLLKKLRSKWNHFYIDNYFTENLLINRLSALNYWNRKYKRKLILKLIKELQKESRGKRYPCRIR